MVSLYKRDPLCKFCSRAGSRSWQTRSVDVVIIILEEEESVHITSTLTMGSVEIFILAKGRVSQSRFECPDLESGSSLSAAKTSRAPLLVPQRSKRLFNEMHVTSSDVLRPGDQSQIPKIIFSSLSLPGYIFLRQNSLIIFPKCVVVLYSEIIWSMSSVFSSRKTLSLRSSTGPTIQ